MHGSTIDGFSNIKKLLMALVTATLLFCSASARAQSGGSLSPTPITPQSVRNGVEILSDTNGVDFGPYIQQALQLIKRSWLSLIPEEARPHGTLRGETLIRLTILPDGRIRAMHLDESSHNVDIDRAAWGGITGVGQFPALPPEFKGPSLELRIDFFTNLPVPVKTSPLQP